MRMSSSFGDSAHAPITGERRCVVENAMTRIAALHRRSGRLVLSVVLALMAACSTSGSATVDLSEGTRYLTSHPALDSVIAGAILGREPVIGMTAEEALAAGARPVLRRTYPRSGRESWLVSVKGLRLGHYRYHNARMLRLGFEAGRVIAVQPID